MIGFFSDFLHVKIQFPMGEVRRKTTQERAV